MGKTPQPIVLDIIAFKASIFSQNLKKFLGGKEILYIIPQSLNMFAKELLCAHSTYRDGDGLIYIYIEHICVT